MTENANRTRREIPVRRPIVDVFESGEAVTFQFEMPGIPSDRIDVGLDKDTLRVSTRADVEDSARGEFALREFVPANFSREFVLSRDLDRENIQASWHDGVLTLVVPKAAEARPRKIKIESQ